MNAAPTRLAALAAAAFACALPLAAAGPRAMAPEPIVDVGTVTQGDEVRHGFTLSNLGDEVLEITEVRPSCGCTVVRYPRRVEPGKSSQLEAVLDTSEFRGPMAKSVLVFTNDPKNPRIQLVIKANIRTDLEIKPGYARFVVVQGEEYGASEQTIRSSDGKAFEITTVKSPYPFLAASYGAVAGDGEAAAGPAEEWRLVLTLGAAAPVGPMADAIVVHTTHPSQSELRIPVSGFVRPPLAVVPEAFDFGRQELAETLPATIEIRVLTSGPVRLEEPASDIAGLELEVEEIERGRRYNLLLRLTPGMAKGPVEGELVVQTSSPLQPELRIPVSGTVL